VTRNDAFRAKGGEQTIINPWHCGTVKNEAFNERLDRLAKPGMGLILAVDCGFWVSQLLALYFFSGFLISGRPDLSGPLSIAVFAFFFVLHFFRPWSKMAAILGLCSLGVLAGYLEYLNSPVFNPPVPSPNLFVLLSVALAFAGLVLDAATSWQLATKVGERPLKLTGAPLLQPEITSRQQTFDILW
jgi:hypothetical protein